MNEDLKSWHFIVWISISNSFLFLPSFLILICLFTLSLRLVTLLRDIWSLPLCLINCLCAFFFDIMRRRKCIILLNSIKKIFNTGLVFELGWKLNTSSFGRQILMQRSKSWKLVSLLISLRSRSKIVGGLYIGNLHFPLLIALYKQLTYLILYL